MDRIWAEVQRRIDLGSDGRPALRAPAPVRALSLAVAAAACTVALVTALVLGGAAPRKETAAAGPASGRVVPAVPTFEELAASAGAQPGRVLTEHAPYLHLVVDQEPQPGQQPLPNATRELWVGADGSGVARTAPLHGTFGPPVLVNHKVAGFTPGAVPTLPTDVPELLRAIEVAHSEKDHLRPAERIGMLLAVPLVAPAGRAALVRALAHIGARVVTTVEGPSGQPAVVVDHVNGDGDRTTLVIDIATVRTQSIRNEGTFANPSEPALRTYVAADLSPPV